MPLQGTTQKLRPATVSLLAKLVLPLTDSGLVTTAEYELVFSHLRYLAKHGTPQPAITPKLVTPQEAAEILAISYSQFRALEKENVFPFRRRRVGDKTVRYLNTDIIHYIEAASEVSANDT